MQEIETKILEVQKEEIENVLISLGAEKILDTKLTVDWFRPIGTIPGEDPWYLRIRTTADGKSEATWKSKPNFVGISKQVKEINLPVESPELLSQIFEAIGLLKYAHQEKYRTSWRHKEWRFDLDQYPGMPAYLEIEGKNEDHLHEAIRLLNLQNHEAVSDGERVVIESKYKLDWHNMKFAEK